MLYKIRITEIESGKVEELQIKTDRLEWFLEQYQRNRMPFRWKIIK
tara:strand:- start:1419 stop:1556 length:138 start_codon:yes stop_codon:yes gene_type:complete